MKRLAAVLSLAVPGLGQAVQGRIGDALLFGWAAFWLHLLPVGMARALIRAPHDSIDVFLFGGLAVEGGLAKPAIVLMLALAAAVHLLAMVDAWRGPNRAGRGQDLAPVSSTAQPSDTAAF